MKVSSLQNVSWKRKYNKRFFLVEPVKQGNCDKRHSNTVSRKFK